MKNLYTLLENDIRFKEGLSACINCGTCTAICAAAEFYKYDPRELVNTLQTKDNEKIEALLKSDFIWYCGECMSCATRCPRGNTPGLIIMALRSLSQDLGYFTESEKGRQQLAVKRTIGSWIFDYGYCVYPDFVSYENHPEQGPVWEWKQKNQAKVMERLGANYKGNGPGILRKIPQEALDELKKIAAITGCTERFDKIEECSKKKALEMGIDFGTESQSAYVDYIYTENSEKHG